jgi:2-polyprenyl-3-methyl-5-hydroxy-6-metoxy-1,4-benzoquinol methylase
MENAIAQFYTQNASVYDPAMERSFISRLIRGHFQSCLATSFCGVDQVLDVGCGTGTDALFLAEKGVKVEAIGHLECRVMDEKIWGDHTVFVGKVLKTDMEEGKTKELYHVTKFQ